MNSEKEMRERFDCECDRIIVCGTIGECFLKRIEMPKWMQNQIKNARSPKQALQIFRTIKDLNHE